MVANLDGTRAVYQFTPAWHRIGFVSEEEITDGHEFLKEARGNYIVAKQRALVEHGDALAELNALANAATVDPERLRELLDQIQPVENQFHLVRDDDRRVVSPATVTKQYTQLIPGQMVEALQPFVDSGWARWDAFFVMDGGRSEVLTLKLVLPEEFRINGDESPWDAYIATQNFHGRGAYRGRLTGIRGVCQNTVSMIFAGGADFRLTHSASIEQRMQVAVKTWDALNEELAKVKEHCGILANTECDIEEAVNAVLGIEADGKVGGKAPSAQLVAKQQDLISRANDESAGTYGTTLYDVFNAVTNRMTHSEVGKGGKTVEGRLSSQLTSTRGRFEKKSFETLLALTI